MAYPHFPQPACVDLDTARDAARLLRDTLSPIDSIDILMSQILDVRGLLDGEHLVLVNRLRVDHTGALLPLHVEKLIDERALRALHERPAAFGDTAVLDDV